MKMKDKIDVEEGEIQKGKEKKGWYHQERSKFLEDMVPEISNIFNDLTLQNHLFQPVPADFHLSSNEQICTSIVAISCRLHRSSQ